VRDDRLLIFYLFQRKIIFKKLIWYFSVFKL